MKGLYRARLNLEQYSTDRRLPDLPALITASHVPRVELTDRSVHWCRRHMIVTDSGNEYSVHVSVGPILSDARINRLTGDDRYDFLAKIGWLRHESSPAYLTRLTQGIHLHLYGDTATVRQRRGTSYPWEPDGPWRWIPPTRPDEWLTRAEATFPKPEVPTLSLPDLVLTLRILRSPYYDPSCVGETVDLAVHYMRRKKTSQVTKC